MRKMIAVLMAVCLALTFTSCNSTPAPEKALGKMLDALAGGKISRAEKYVAEGTLNVTTKNKNAKIIYNEMFSSISYSISGSSIDEDSAEVSVTVSMIDMEALMVEASVEALETSMSTLTGGSNKFYKLLAKKIQSGSVSYESYSVTVYMVKTGGKWKVNMSKSSKFADAITGGVGELIGY